MPTLDEPITIWGVGTIRTFRVHWMLYELGLNYETRRIESRTGETTTPEYIRLNPRGKIPLMTHGDLILAESYAIMHYLSNITDNPARDDYQDSIAGRARYDEWLSFILMELDATSLYVVRRHKDLPDIYGAAPAAVTSSMAYFERMLAAIADRIHGSGPIWGQTFSELDILMTVALDWAAVLGISLPGNLSDYQQLMRSREAYKAARIHNFRDLQMPTVSK